MRRKHETQQGCASLHFSTCGQRNIAGAEPEKEAHDLQQCPEVEVIEQPIIVSAEHIESPVNSNHLI
jgi:hypothetical protein